MGTVTVSCPGTCGELIQGYVSGEIRLASNGISRHSKATIGHNQLGNISKVGGKTLQAMFATGRYLGVSDKEMESVWVSIHSNLSLSKGMASSTADMAATVLATGLYFGHRLTSVEIAHICTKIEPTDSMFFDSLTIFDSKSAKYVDKTNWFPDYFIMMLEPTTCVNTQAFHTEKTHQLFKEQESSFLEVYQLFLEAVAERNITKLGYAATQSARLNQTILPKPFFEELLQVSSGYSTIFGLNVAHSGTVVGLLLTDTSEVSQIELELNRLNITSHYKKITVHPSCYEGLKHLGNE